MVCLRRCRKTTCRGGITTECCPGQTFPTALTGTITAAAGGAPGCGFTVGASFTVNWNAITNCYELFMSSVGCSGISDPEYLLCCTASGWRGSWAGGGSGNSGTVPTSESCSPIQIVFDFTLNGSDLACCGGLNAAGTFQVTYTE